MVRINLLPREAIEKRRFEQRIGYVILGGVLAGAIVLVVFGILMFMVASRNSVLQQQLESNAQIQEQAQAYAIFEEKEVALEDRSTVAQDALSGRVSWGQITNEISLVLPDDSWVFRMEGDEVEGMLLEGYALDPLTDIPDHGLKSVAKTLIRLQDLPLLTSVWLDEAEQEEYGEGEDEETEPVIRFSISTSVEEPVASDTQEGSSVPAPPSQPAE